jgi:hypothetical protein
MVLTARAPIVPVMMKRNISMRYSVPNCVSLRDIVSKHSNIISSFKNMFHTNSFIANKLDTTDDFSTDSTFQNTTVSLLDYTPKELEALVGGSGRVQQVWNLIRCLLYPERTSAKFVP